MIARWDPGWRDAEGRSFFNDFFPTLRHHTNISGDLAILFFANLIALPPLRFCLFVLPGPDVLHSEGGREFGIPGRAEPVDHGFGVEDHIHGSVPVGVFEAANEGSIDVVADEFRSPFESVDVEGFVEAEGGFPAASLIPMTFFAGGSKDVGVHVIGMFVAGAAGADFEDIDFDLMGSFFHEVAAGS